MVLLSADIARETPEVSPMPSVDERSHSRASSPGSMCSYRLLESSPMVQRVDEQELSSTSVFCDDLPAPEGHAGPEPGSRPAALRRRRQRAEARLLAAEEQLLGLDEQERLLLARGTVIGCQRQGHEAKLRSVRERRAAAEDERLAAAARVERLRSAEALPCPSGARSEARLLEPEQCQAVRLVKAPRTARSPRPGSSVVVEGLASRSPSPNARSSLGGSVSVPLPGHGVVARGETTSSAKVRSLPSNAHSLLRGRQQQSPQRSRPQSPPAQPAVPAPLVPRRQTSGPSDRPGLAAFTAAARGTKSPIRRRPQSPLSCRAPDLRCGTVKASPEDSREPKALTTRIGYQQKGIDLKAQLAALPEEELCQLLTSLPRERLEGALAVRASGGE